MNDKTNRIIASIKQKALDLTKLSTMRNDQSLEAKAVEIVGQMSKTSSESSCHFYFTVCGKHMFRDDKFEDQLDYLETLCSHEEVVKALFVEFDNHPKFNTLDKNACEHLYLNIFNLKEKIKNNYYEKFIADTNISIVCKITIEIKLFNVEDVEDDQDVVDSENKLQNDRFVSMVHTDILKFCRSKIDNSLFYSVLETNVLMLN